MPKIFWVLPFFIFSFIFKPFKGLSQEFSFEVSFEDTTSHTYHVKLSTQCDKDSNITFKMPNWMPGYYQMMHYGKDLSNFKAKDGSGKLLSHSQLDDHTWQVSGTAKNTITIQYDIKTSKQFVANSYVDQAHAYLIPCNTFLYVDGQLDNPITVKITKPENWRDISTGLLKKGDDFYAPNFDILYDCPFLIGNLESLEPFKIEGINHYFTGYQLGEFDKQKFMQNLEAMVRAAVDIIGDIPYRDYTFIGIGPGRGGIEHLNNTTVSFDGNGLKSPERFINVMNFLAHEYFHHYNVKRIRPVELGPFDYEKGSRSNLLWISEGLTVYYEFLIVNRAGITTGNQMIKEFENLISGLENNSGRKYQSLSQASYNTWKDGPFGGARQEKGKTISYYQKGPIVGLLLDFAIRNSSNNEKSLDDVMRYIYFEYYKKLQRGFTDAEFQQACEMMAGSSLEDLFEYINTTKELDYEKYLTMGGLELSKQDDQFTLKKLSNPNSLQSRILSSWMKE